MRKKAKSKIQSFRADKELLRKINVLTETYGIKKTELFIILINNEYSKIMDIQAKLFETEL